MATRKSVDTPAMQARRMPFVAKIKRDDPFHPNDLREISAMCRRIAGSSEYLSKAGWREDADYSVYRFTTWARARAMQHWIDRSGIAHRPMPKLGSTRDETAAEKRAGLAWGLRTGAARPIVQMYQLSRYAGDSDLTAFNAACVVAQAYGRPTGEIQVTVRTLLGWARERRRGWFIGIY